MQLDDVTVVVPTKNEAANIGAFLASLPEAVRLVVVDASDDATPLLVARRRPARTTVLREPAHIAEARQLGAEAATTAWLLFTDADIAFDAGYFDRLRQLRGADAWYGPKLSRDAHRGHYRRFAAAQALSHRLGIPAASGSNLLVRREALLAAGGFDRRLTCNEDSEVVWRMKRQGRRVGFDPGLVVWARDHRRIARGSLGKTLHSVARCTALYLGLVPERWRGHDWGYWSEPR
jgi:glycosyltransferase involved in cell wall biosynthesis